MKFLEIDSTSGIIKQSSTEATSTPTPNAIPIANADGKLDDWVEASSANVGGKYGIDFKRISNDITLTPGVDAIYQYIDPGGADRNVILDTSNANVGDRFIIKNDGIATSSSIHYLTIKSGSSTVGVQYPQQQVEWIYNGSQWISLQDLNQRNVTWGYKANGGYFGFAIGYLSYGYNFGTSIGYGSSGYSNGCAVGYSAVGYTRGVSVGYYSYGYNYGVAIGSNSNGSTYGAAFGYQALGYSYGVSVGYYSRGYSYGVAIGGNSYGDNYGVSIGYLSKGENQGVSIGYQAGSDVSSNLKPNRNIFIGYMAGTNVYGASRWFASNTYAYNSYVNPTTWNGYSYQCITEGGGTSGSTEPNWPTTLGATVNDGEITWKCVPARGNNNIYIGYGIYGSRYDTDQLNIGNLIYGNLHDKYWMIPKSVNIPTAKSGFGILYVASDGSLHYLGQNGTDTKIADA